MLAAEHGKFHGGNFSYVELTLRQYLQHLLLESEECQILGWVGGTVCSQTVADTIRSSLALSFSDLMVYPHFFG